MKKEIPATVDVGSSLYVSEAKIHPREIDGLTQRLRKLATIVLLGMYYLFPWLNWDGHQAVLFDLPARKFYVFGLTFWPQDFIFLAILLIIAGLALFFFTALAGRLWCGYACPQTVWTEIFIGMEQVFEGDRSARIRLDKSPWTREKILKRGSRHAAWIVFALWTGFTFVGFFTPIRDLGARAWPFEWGGWETFWVLFYSLATCGNAGILREQVCKYMCPYARFQSAMFDLNTLIISYDAARGEPRGPRKRGSLETVLTRDRGKLSNEQAEAAVFHAARHQSVASQSVQARATTGLIDAWGHTDGELGASLFEQASADFNQLGDCIDCTLCVQVCPTGIDIRNGLQYECIACGACIDACDSVMDKVGYPRGLIRHTTQNAIEGKKTRILRPRILIYGTLLLALLIGWGVGVTTRKPLIVEVLHDRNALYRETSQGVENGYGLKLVNKEGVERRYRVTLAESGSITLDDAPLEIAVPAGEVLSLPVTLLAPAGEVKGRKSVEFVIERLEGETLRISQEAAFFGPVR